MDTTTDAQRTALRRAAEVVGGQSALATLCGYPDRRHVWPWFNDPTRRVPAEKCPLIEEGTRRCAAERDDPSLVVRCEDLRPDVAWGVLREQSSPTEQAT